MVGTRPAFLIALALSAAGVSAAQQPLVRSHLHFVDVDTGADVETDSVTNGAGVVSLERSDVASGRTARWSVRWHEDGWPDVSVQGWNLVGAIPRSRDHAGAAHAAVIPLRSARRTEFKLPRVDDDFSDRMPVGELLARTSPFEPRGKLDCAFDRELCRVESAAASEPTRLSEFARDAWRGRMGMCSLAASTPDLLWPLSANAGRCVDVWGAPTLARWRSNEFDVRDRGALPARDLPRYAGRHFAPIGTRSTVESELAPDVALSGRVEFHGASIPLGLSVQLSIADEPFARAPRAAVPESPGTRASLAPDATFAFPALSPGPYWIGCVRGSEPAGRFVRIDVGPATRDVVVELGGADFEPEQRRSSSSGPSDLARAWAEPRGAGPVRTLTLVGASADAELAAYRLQGWNGFVPAAREVTSGYAILRTLRERIAVVDVAAARAVSTDPSAWPLEWRVPARICLVWYGGAEDDPVAARFDVVANEVLVERCWLEPGDVRELTVPPGAIVVTTRPQRAKPRERRARLVPRDHWIVRER